jgi:Polyketide synthase dehydratase
MTYGSGHQGIDSLSLGVEHGAVRVLARLTLPGHLRADLRRFTLHPSLLDSALRASIGLGGLAMFPLSPEASNFQSPLPPPALPFAVDQVDILGSCTPIMWAVLWEAGPSGSVRFPIDASCHIGIQHPALDGEAPFGEVLPGMPPCNRGPANAERLQTGTQRQKHAGMITHDGIRRAPPRDRLAADLDDAGEVLSVEAAGSHKGPPIAVEQENTVEPMPLDCDQIPHIDIPDLMGSSGVLGTLVGIRWAFL